MRRALVLSGGGARGGYEAGVIHYIRTMLPEPERQLSFHIQSGTSVGAVNTCFMAATSEDKDYQGKQIWNIWKSLTNDQIYLRDGGTFLKLMLKSAWGLAVNQIRGTGRPAAHFDSLFNPKPFIPFLKKNIPWRNISKNLDAGIIDAVSVVATNLITGVPELFIQKRKEIPYVGSYRANFTKLHFAHILASAAIPIVFPHVRVGGVPYIDGGMRMNTPISPAIQLGAEKILVIGTMMKKEFEGEQHMGQRPKTTQVGIGDTLGRIFNSIFLDHLQNDVEQLERINNIIRWTEEVYGSDYLVKLNAKMKETAVRKDIAARGLKKIHVLCIQPTQPISEIFQRCYSNMRTTSFSLFERFLFKMLELDPSKGLDIVSYMSFSPEYMKNLLELGFEDARSKHDELLEFFSPDTEE